MMDQKSRITSYFLLFCFMKLMLGVNCIEAANINSSEATPGFYSTTEGNYSEGKENAICEKACVCQGSADRFFMTDCLSDPSHELEEILGHYLGISSLTITNSSLSKLPQVVCNMTQLTELDLHHNLLEELPWECLRSLKINNLKLNENRFTRIRNGTLYDFVNLKYFDMSFNRIELIEADVFEQGERLPSLQYIYLQGNSLSDLAMWPVTLGNRDRQVYIELDDNKISTFSNPFKKWFGCPKNMVNMRIYRNRIAHIQPLFSGWSFNEATKLTLLACLSEPKSNLKMYLKYNPFVCDCKDFEYYKLIHVSHHSTVLGGLICDSPFGLANRAMRSIPLDKFVCQVRQGCPEGCECVDIPNAMNMSVTCKGLGELPKELPPFPKHNYKYNLYFQNNNKLRALAIYPYVSQTAEAWFSGNLLSAIPANVLKAFKYADSLRLDHNNLTHIDENTTRLNLTSIGELKLGHNPLTCDCNSQGTQAWIIHHKKVISDYGSVLCGSPSYREGTNMLTLTKHDLCSNPVLERLWLQIGLGTGVPIAAVGFVIFPIVLYIKRLWIFRTFGIRVFPFFKSDNKDKEFDAFISYAQADEEYIEDKFIPEFVRRGYTYRIHKNSFEYGKSYYECTDALVKLTRKTIVFLSKGYLQCNDCVHDFKEANEYGRYLRQLLLVVIKTDEVEPDESMDPYVKTFLETDAPIIKYESETLWDEIEEEFRINSDTNDDPQSPDAAPLIEPNV